MRISIISLFAFAASGALGQVVSQISDGELLLVQLHLYETVS